MTVKWSEAPGSALDIVEEMRRLYHPYLKEARIGVVMRSEASASQGREVWAKISKVDEKTKALMEANGAEACDLLIWIAEDVWMRLGHEQRCALVDHELCHATIGGKGYKLVGHDFEEFIAILERWGLWNHGLLASREAMKQALLPFEYGGQGAVVAVQPELMVNSQAEANT